MNGWTPIFRAGRHIDGSGRAHTYTVQDLQRTAAAYDPAQHKAPLVLGHPSDDAPAFGWVEDLRVDGETLLARLGQVPDELRQAVAAGRYRHKSVALYPDGRLRHVGLLGATPPAVKGLGPVNFGDGEGDWAEFSDPDNKPKGDDMPTQEEFDRVRRERDQARAEAQAAKQAQTEAEAKFAEAETARKAAEDGKAKLEAEFAEHKATAAQAAREARFSELVAAGKAKPSEKAGILELASALAVGGGELTFSEGGQTTKVSAEEAYWRQLEERPADESLLREFAEAAGRDKGGDGGEDVDAAKAAQNF